MPNLPNLVQTWRPSSILTSSRVAIYVAASCVAVIAIVHKAFLLHNNFYSAAIFVSRDSTNAMILANFAFVLTLIAGKITQKLFFGPLRDLEVERLYERIWIFLTESLLAFTIFRDEFDVAFGAMFGFLLFIKCFHWLMADRIEWMDQEPYPGPNVLFHIRILILFIILSFTDLVMLAFAAESIVTHGVGGIVLFGSEYAILMASAYNCLAKYMVFSYDQRRARNLGGENAPVWENKSMHLFYIDLVTDFLKLITYLAFFVLVLTFYGLPLNIIRDVYLTGRSFYQRCRDLVRYRAATKNMDERYPNATTAEMELMIDKTCIICREEMVSKSEADSTEATDCVANRGADNQAGPNVTPKKLPCGHIFHFHCLRSWLERQQSCPTCRRGVLEGSSEPQGAARAPPAVGGAPPQAQPRPGDVAAGGFFGRVFGEEGAAPPLAPGQLHAAAQPERNPLAPYPWPYDRVRPGSNLQLRPPPQFRGFNMGPNGPWQPWVNNPQPPGEGTPSSISKESTAPTPTSTTSPSTTTTASQPVITARQAAAEAALRRSTSANRSTLLTGHGRDPSLVSGARNTPELPLTSISTAPPPNTNAVTAAAATPATGRPSARIPSLIPLFDPTLMQNRRSQLNPAHSSGSQPSLEKAEVLTREAIDERLKVLDGVQDALWKSAQDLLKLRSSFTSVTSPPGVHSPPETVETPSAALVEDDHEAPIVSKE